MSVPSANRPIAGTWFTTPRPRAEVFILRKESTRLAVIVLDGTVAETNGAECQLAIEDETALMAGLEITDVALAGLTNVFSRENPA